MAPKAKGKSAPAPKGGAKAKAKAEAKADPEAEAKAKAKLWEAEAKEMWEKHEEEGAMKLKGFAECIRNMNIKKCNLWTDDDVGPFIKKQWTDVGGFAKRQLEQEPFLQWWPAFMEIVEEQVVAKAKADEAKEEEKVAAVAAKASKYDGKGMWEIPLKDLQDAINEAYKRNKTPLIIDMSDAKPTDAFFSYSGAHVIECKKMIMDKVKGASPQEILEELQGSFFRAHCFKYGTTVMFRLANSAADIKGTFNGEVFPSLALLDAAQVTKCLGADNADNFKGSAFDKMCPNDEERMECICGINEKFRVIAVSHFADTLGEDGIPEYQKFLEPMFPMELMQPIKPVAT